MQIEIRQQLIDGAPSASGNDVSANDVSGNQSPDGTDPDGAGEGTQANGTAQDNAGENGAGQPGANGTAQDNAGANNAGQSGENGAAKPGETDAASTENTAPAETNPYVNEDGQLIDPDTGELITEDSDGFETPVSGILGGSGEAGNADAAGGAENPE